MRKYILVGLILFPSASIAQEQKVYTITVNAGEVGMIAQGIGTLPYRDAAPLLKKLDEQLAAQSRPPEPKPAEPVPHIEQPK